MGSLFPGVDGVLYFGNELAGGNRTSSHHLARLLAQHERVVYVESPGLRTPTVTRRDVRRVATKVRAVLRGPRANGKGHAVETIAQVPLHGFMAARAANRLLLGFAARRILRRHALSSPLTWFTVPHLAPLAGRLGEGLSVYYCVDDYAEMPGVDRAAVQRLDDQLTRAADVVFVTSETLLARKRLLNPHTHFSPHGVDAAHFGQAQDSRLDVAPDVAGLRGGVVGYFGLIDGRTDLALVARLATERPQWTFVMVGQVAVKDQTLPRVPNLIYTGARPYEALPAYGRRFDVMMMPYRRLPSTAHANPLKLREYLAMGKPVVSVALPAVEEFADVVLIARDGDEFGAKLDQAMKQATDPAADRFSARRRMQRVAALSWEARFDEVARIVGDRLRYRRAARSNVVPRPFAPADLEIQMGDCL